MTHPYWFLGVLLCGSILLIWYRSYQETRPARVLQFKARYARRMQEARR